MLMMLMQNIRKIRKVKCPVLVIHVSYLISLNTCLDFLVQLPKASFVCVTINYAIDCTYYMEPYVPEDLWFK